MIGKNQRIIVAVDGPAGSGKSSVSKEVAKCLGLKYIDSGAIYRSITWFLLQKHGSPLKRVKYSGELSSISISQEFTADGTSLTSVNGEDVSLKIRDESIARNIGVVSDDPEIRGYVNSILREWSGNESIIMDGRDIGTVVFPVANIKIYLDASVDVRAQRRFQEYNELGKTVDFEAIKNQIVLRDKEDNARPFGALQRAKDAIYLDTSGMSRKEVIKKIIEIIHDCEINYPHF